MASSNKWWNKAQPWQHHFDSLTNVHHHLKMKDKKKKKNPQHIKFGIVAVMRLICLSRTYYQVALPSNWRP